MSQISPNIEQPVGRRVGVGWGETSAHVRACLPPRESKRKAKQKLLEPKIPKWAPMRHSDALIQA